jgi:2,4-dienoyl-CoA reductase-like NADH-dependent reductase (Old Yellow Enzyme family)
MSHETKLRRFREIVQDVTEELKEHVYWPSGYRLYVRAMSKKESEKEGIAIYQGRTLRVNRALLRLPITDQTLLALHEITHHLQQITQHATGHYVQESDECMAAEERCAVTCEKKWAPIFAIPKTTVKDWEKYQESRAKLDTAVKEGRVKTVAQARQLMLDYGVPKRLIRAKVELDRVKERPGEVQGYVNGTISKSPDCPCI